MSFTSAYVYADLDTLSQPLGVYLEGNLALWCRLPESWVTSQYGETGWAGTPLTNNSGEIDELFDREAYGNPLVLDIPVEDGIYEVNIHFLETYWGYAGDRVFSVEINGVEVETDLDIIDEVGKYVTLLKTYSGLEISGGMNITMTASSDNAEFRAMSFQRTGDLPSASRPDGLLEPATYDGTSYATAANIPFTERLPTIIVPYSGNSLDGIQVEAETGTVNTASYRYSKVQIPISELTPDNGNYHVPLDILWLRNNDAEDIVGTQNLTLTPYNSYGLGDSSSYTFTQSLPAGSEESWQYLASTVIRDTLIANLDASTIATITEDSTVKIFWEDADEKWSQPFILNQIITGGDLNSAQVPYAEMLWRVVVHTPNVATAGSTENAIHKALARATPVINFAGVTSAGKIEEVTPVTDRYQVQQVPMFVSGAIYRIRLAKG